MCVCMCIKKLLYLCCSKWLLFHGRLRQRKNAFKKNYKNEKKSAKVSYRNSLWNVCVRVYEYVCVCTRSKFELYREKRE